MREKNQDLANYDATKTDLQSYANLLRKAQKSIVDMFDGIFGDGTANKLFGDEVGFDEVLLTYFEFEDAITKQQNDLADQVNNRYTPDTSERK